MPLSQPATLSDSIMRRVNEQRFAHSIPLLYLKRLQSDIEKLREIEPEDRVFSALGSLYTINGEKSKAIESHLSAVNLNSNALNLYNLGFTYEVFGDLPIAYQQYLLSLESIQDNDLLMTETLLTKFAFLFDGESLGKLQEQAQNLKVNTMLAEQVLSLKPFFDSSEKMLDFGLKINHFIHQYINPRFIVDMTYQQSENRTHIVFSIYCQALVDIDCVAKCNAKLSEFMVDYEYNNQLNFDHFFVSCEAL